MSDSPSWPIVMVNLVQMVRADSTSPLSDFSSDTHEGERSTPDHRVLTGEAAALIADPLRAVFLYPFIGRERTASEVAAEFGWKLSRLLYQIKRLCSFELLQITRIETRGGSPIKWYRATANAFFVPLEATDQESIEALLNRWVLSLNDVYLRSFAKALSGHAEHWGIRISRSADGRLRIIPAVDPSQDWNFFAPDSPVLMEGWYTDLWMDLPDAKRFQLELAGLYLRYRELGGAQRYIVRVALAPMADAQELPPEW